MTWVWIITCCFGMLRGGRNEYDKQGRSSVRKKRKCGREWRGRTSGKVNWERYQEKKKMAKDLVRKKRREEREALLKE